MAVTETPTRFWQRERPSWNFQRANRPCNRANNRTRASEAFTDGEYEFPFAKHWTAPEADRAD